MAHDTHHHEGSYLTPKGGPMTVIWDWATTVDHKKIGVMYLFAILFMFFLGGISAIFVRLELWEPTRIVEGVVQGQLFAQEGATSISAGNDIYNRIFTLHGAIMVFMVLVPSVPASLGNFFLPLLIGAKDVAFPRLNLLSWYIYVLGSLFAVTAIILGGVDTGWTFYTPYSTTTDLEYWRVAIMVLGAFILGFSSILTGLNFVVTVHKLRAPGMGWFDMPLFVWNIYAASILQVLATPVIGITLLLLVLERVLRIGIFDPALGGDPVLYQHFFWFYSHPVVYVMILPGMAIISEVITTHARKSMFGYRAMAYSGLGIAGVSFIVWGHHMFTSMSEAASVVFSALTFLVAIPTAVKVFNWTVTLYKGSIAVTTPMLYALIFLFLFAIGGLTGLPLGTLATDVHLHDSYFVVAHFHYVMMGGTLMALMAGLHHWWPKMFGKLYNEPVAKFAAIVVFLGFNLTFFTQFFIGVQGMPRRYASYPDAFTTLHQWSTIGSLMLLVGFLIHLFVFVHSLVAGRKAPQNPWGSLTLEWATDSPPPEHNFHHEPLVTHGPYDYESVVPPGMDPADYPIPGASPSATVVRSPAKPD
ncbi:MAG: cbb3-type cytochrome c oxidase subunit I [Phycisphaerales bacterium]|nr:cbb3-type cytochrome c oxidase subunit I [Phycisphaerales bacterium]NUQ68495.1 cbb3-type cytochrome c oxidase subunit I [Phycisphaerales bacterium]